MRPLRTTRIVSRFTPRFTTGAVIALATCVATLALAQTRPVGGAKPAGKPARPTAPKVDAQAPDESRDTTSAADSGAPPEPPPVAEANDGGGKPSPLNPTAQEMPNTTGDSGAPGTPLDYDRLLADIAALRARVAAVSDNLYQSRVAVALQTDGDHGKIARLTVSLDDGVVFTAPQTFAASDMTPVYDHAVAPGRHAVTVDVERKDARDEAFRTSQRSRFSVDVPRDNKVDVQVKVIDDSSMGADFPSDRSGKYDLRFRVKAVAKPVGK